LFEEDFEAWPWGPVVRDVYFDTRQYGRAPVAKHVTKLERVGIGSVDFQFRTPKVYDAETKSFIRSIWDIHKEFSGVQLSNATHGVGEPWTIMKDKYNGNLDGKPTIPNELIEAVFKKKLLDGAQENSAAAG